MDGLFFGTPEGTRTIRYNSPVDCCSIPARRNRHHNEPSPFRCTAYWTETPFAMCANSQQTGCEETATYAILKGNKPTKGRTPWVIRKTVCSILPPE